MNTFFKGLLISTLFVLSNIQAADLQPRIIGGDPAVEGEFPATVALLFTDVYNARLAAGDTVGIAQFQAQFCAGTLLAPNWVLTAAHCVHDVINQPLSAAEILVLAGVTDLTADGQQRVVTNIIVHPNYVATTNTFDSDIALLELANNTLPPAADISLYQGDPAVGSVVTVVGWGVMTNGGDDFPFILQKVDLQVVSDADCDAAYNGVITDNMICAAADGKDSCGGDSGGPMMADQNGELHQVGIVSFGTQCALPDFPGVYTRVDRFRTWINDTMSGTSSGGGGGSSGAFSWFMLPIGLLMLLFRKARHRLFLRIPH